MSISRQPTPGIRTEPAPAPTHTAPRLPEDQVRQRAYQIFMARTKEGVPGDPISDWIRAEQELRNRPR